MRTMHSAGKPGLPTLHGNRTTLRWMTEDDLEDLLAIWGDDRVMRYMSRMPLRDLEETRQFLGEIVSSAEDGSLFQWGITRKGQDQVVGTCTLAGIDRQHRQAEIGFALHPDHWRQGLISDAAAVLVRYAFETLDLHRIDADVDPRNPGSLRLLENLGFQREGYRRECLYLWGEWQDAITLGLLRHEWTGS